MNFYNIGPVDKLCASSCATSRAPDGKRAIWKALWRYPTPPKVRIFGWQIATNSLATMENKHKRTLEKIGCVCPMWH